MQLFGIERDTYQATLDQNKGQLAHDEGVLSEARLDLTRYQKLQQEKSISGQQAEDQVFVVEQDKATVEVDKANVETANINLSFTSVLAPFDGIVTNHQADLGTFLSSSGSTTLATIIQSSPLYANFTLSEPQIIELQKSSAKAGHLFATTDLTYLSSIPVEVGMQGEEGYPHKGHLDYASPQVTMATGTLTMRALFENKDQTLLPGLFVRVRVPIGHKERALLTQNSAIGTSQEGSYVLVVGDDNVVQRRIVKTGQQEGQLRVIESGLSPNDWVVIEGVQRAIPGAKVAPQQSKVAVAANPVDPLAQ
jgi:RND family efflux transporter MFP subunit